MLIKVVVTVLEEIVNRLVLAKRVFIFKMDRSRISKLKKVGFRQHCTI